MKKILFAAFAALAMFQTAWADYSKDNLVVQTKEGGESTYSLTTRPVMKFNGGEMILKSGSEEFKFALGNVQQIIFAGGQVFPKGDVNGDGIVDVSDANSAFNVVLGVVDASVYGGRADVNGDGVVDVADANEIINLILNN